ncbi:MAG: hypothetical protein AMXMBFR66_24880 [Pseudomonadota bacterium]|jgi:DNA-binding transcriptional MerR regulator|nr:MerR family transcriptional regulator [Rubrivivax sp.]NLZ42455.1 MerR family transcriptional regulator [Comamonadaceae bacterium]
MEKALPAIPAKRYFTIGEVSDLCGVKPYVLRYWEQEFTQLKPMKRRGNRRYYQHHEVLLVRRIRDLLYEQGFTISGARNRLADSAVLRSPGMASATLERAQARMEVADPDRSAAPSPSDVPGTPAATSAATQAAEEEEEPRAGQVDWSQLRAELRSIRNLLEG